MAKITGVFEEIDPNTQAQVGVVYEHRIKTSLPSWMVSPVIQGVLGLQSQFSGLEILYYDVNEQTGDIVYQFRYPAGLAGKALALPLIVIIIAVIIAILAGYIILQQVGIIKNGDIDIMALVPGIVVTSVGGVMMGVIPGKGKLAGLPVFGIGIYMILKELGLIPNGDGPPPPPPPGEFGAEIIKILIT